MNDINLYQAPESDIRTPDDDAVGELRLFSWKGRVGRMRFIARSVGLVLVIWLFAALFGIAAAWLELRQEAFSSVMSILSVLAYLPMMVVSVIWAIQRSHDFNASGWTAILVLVPLINLIFWFIPGSGGRNHYGAAPPPNTLGVKLLFWLMVSGFVLILVLGAGSMLFAAL